MSLYKIKGPHVGKVLEKVIQFQLEFPEAGKDDVVHFLEERREEFLGL